jgi:hypothetical protein
MKTIDKEGVQWLAEMDVLQPKPLTRTMTAVEWLVEQIIKEKGLVDLDIQAAKEMEEEEKGYSKEDLFKILLDFVAFPHHDMEPRGSIIERYLNELSNKKLNN